MYQFNRKEYEERMKWYQDARFGMFIHWGLYLFLQEENGYAVQRRCLRKNTFRL